MGIAADHAGHAGRLLPVAGGGLAAGFPRHAPPLADPRGPAAAALPGQRRGTAAGTATVRLPGTVRLAVGPGNQAEAADLVGRGPADGGRRPDRRPHPPPLPLRADRRARAGHRRDCGRHGLAAADEPPAAGRRGQRQDDRGRVCHAPGSRPRLPGGADGAHRGPRPAACPDARKTPGPKPGPAGAVDRRTGGPSAGRGLAGDRGRPGGPDRGHAGDRPGRRPFPPAGPGGDRRAAQVRRPPAGPLEAGRPGSALPGDDGHAHSPHADHDALRRSGRLHPPRQSARPAEGPHLSGRRGETRPLVGVLRRQASRGTAGLRGRAAGRGVPGPGGGQPGGGLRGPGQRRRWRPSAWA